MAAAHRKSDICTGHGCFPPRRNIDGSGNVFVNSLGWHRKGDEWAKHFCDDRGHKSKTAMGSSSVFVNSIEAARVGDPVHCGSACAQGSENVYCGG
jgi:uncharacterized Zn-binding protein involved in type VI secretion